MDGVVAVKDNLNINFGYQGMTLNEHRVGDQVQAGAAIAEVLDLGQLEIGADIDENDRARLAVGQSATLTLDALGGRAVAGEGRSVGTHHAAAVLRPRRGRSVADVLGDARAGRPGRRSAAGAHRARHDQRRAAGRRAARPARRRVRARRRHRGVRARRQRRRHRRRLHADAGQGRSARPRARRSSRAWPRAPRSRSPIRRGVRGRASHAGGHAVRPCRRPRPEAAGDQRDLLPDAGHGRRQPASPTSCARC